MKNAEKQKLEWPSENLLQSNIRNRLHGQTMGTVPEVNKFVK